MSHNRFITENIMRFREKISFRDIAGILIGSAILAFAIQYILVPAHLLTGGVSGVAIILNFFTGIQVWIFYVVLNIPIFIAGYRSISTRFALYSLLGTLALTLFLGIFENISLNLGIHDLLLVAVLGGTLTGIGSGINLRCKGSTGGLDIIAVIFKRYWGYNFGTTSFAVNLIILMVFLFSNSIELTLYTAISMFISSKVLDTVEAGPSASKSAMIVSEKSEEIAHVIMENVHRGCTFLPGQGAYTGQDRKILMVTFGKRQLPKLKEIVFELDPHAFITISDAIEVIGQGFKASNSDF